MGTAPDNSTLDWDVVVNYKESEINELLANSWSNDPQSHIQHLFVEIESYDQDGEKYLIGFNFDLGVPTIKFNGSGNQPSCELTIPINGGEAVSPSQTSQIYASTYEIGLTGLDLATMSGSTGEITSSDKPFVFPPSGSDTAAVIVDMRPSPDSSFNVQLNRGGGASTNAQVEAHLSDIESKLRAWFTNPDNVSSIQYQLASINPTPPPEGYVTLHPKSFRFAAYRSEKYPTTILSLFIQTSDTSNGTQTDLQQNWSGLWVHDYDVPPVPDTHTASVIFNNAMMHSDVVLPALRASGVDADTPQFQAGQGLFYKIRTHKVIAQKAYEEGLNHFDGFSVSLDDDDKILRLTLGQNGYPGNAASGAIAWNYTYKFTYGTTRFVPNPAGGTTTVDDGGTCTVKNALRKTAAFSSKLSDGTLDMDLNIRQGDWDKPDVTKTADSVFNKVFGNAEGPQWFESSLPDMPSLALDMGSLNFFLTTNLLMPDQKVIAIDADAGLRIPHDYYIVGNVAKRQVESDETCA